MERAEHRPEVEIEEKLKYRPKYMVFLGRHAEAAKASIFDQVGGEEGIRSDNFEESSLTLKGIMETHLVSTDMLRAIAAQLPEGKIKIIFGTTRAYRTKETLELIKENIEAEAKRLGKKIKVEMVEPTVIDEITEAREESAEKSREDIDTLVKKVEAGMGASGANVVFIGITHEAKMRNYLSTFGTEVDQVKNSEFLSIVDNKKTNKLTFRGVSVNIPKD